MSGGVGIHGVPEQGKSTPQIKCYPQVLLRQFINANGTCRTIRASTSGSGSFVNTCFASKCAVAQGIKCGKVGGKVQVKLQVKIQEQDKWATRQRYAGQVLYGRATCM